MAGAEKAGRTFRWGFGTAALAVLALTVAGGAVGALLDGYPPAEALFARLRGEAEVPAAFAGFGGRDWVFSAFLLSAAAYAVLQRRAWTLFFRSMPVGVTLVGASCFAVLLGVLVPQIENFEDPEERVNEENYEQNFAQAHWAWSYFLYHAIHLYGVGMPKADVPPAAVEGLERYGRVYGEEQARNREKLMESAFSGQAKTAEIEAFMQRHEGALRKAFDACTWLELNRLYKSDWFAALLGLLAIAVALNAFRPGMWSKWFRLEKLGFFTVHVGVLVLLAGGAWSKLRTDRGILQLHLGEGPSDTYWRHYRPDKQARMPFGVQLDHFARKEWKALEVHYLDEEFRSRPPRFTLWPGLEIPLDYRPDAEGEERPQVLLRVRELHDRARVGLPVVEEAAPDDPQAGFPLVELEVGSPPRASVHGSARDIGGPELFEDEGGTRRLYLSPRLRSAATYHDPGSAYRLRVAHGGDPAASFPAPGEDWLGMLDVEILGSGESAPVPLPVRIGETVDLGRGYSVRFVDATPDMRLPKGSFEERLIDSGDSRPMAERPYRIAAVWLDLFAPGRKEPERRVVLELIDAVSYGKQDQYATKELIARLRWDPWTAPGPPRFVLSWGASSAPPMLVAEDGSRLPAQAGSPLPLPGSSPPLARRFLNRAKVVANDIRFVPSRTAPDGWDPDFYSTDARGLVLDVVHFPGTERETVETVRMATSEASQANVWFSGDERFALKFLENTEGFPFDWRSVLSVVEEDASGRLAPVALGGEKSREIRVNDYFTYRGYRFFQTNAMPEDPTYSGIGVVYDPGIPIVLAGMYTIIAGALLAFIVRPIVRGRARRSTPGRSGLEAAA